MEPVYLKQTRNKSIVMTSLIHSKNTANERTLFALNNIEISCFVLLLIATAFANSNLNSLNSKLTAITTQKNPSKETFQIPIKKRFRASNKKLQIEHSIPSTKTLTNSSTQTDYISNKGKGLDAIEESKYEDFFPSYSDTPTLLYRENLNKVFNDEFIAEASSEELKPNIDLVIVQNWEDLKKVNPLYYKISRDLAVIPTNCLIYENSMIISNKLKHLVLDAIHHKHPGQVGMLALAKLVWWPHIHLEIHSGKNPSMQIMHRQRYTFKIPNT